MQHRPARPRARPHRVVSVHRYTLFVSVCRYTLCIVSSCPRAGLARLRRHRTPSPRGKRYITWAGSETLHHRLHGIKARASLQQLACAVVKRPELGQQKLQRVDSCCLQTYNAVGVVVTLLLSFRRTNGGVAGQQRHGGGGFGDCS